MIRTYKRKLVLTKAQEGRIISWVGVSRTVYNLGLEIRKEAFSKTGKSVHKYELGKQITDLRKDYTWISDVDIGVLQNTIEKLDKSYQGFFKRGSLP